ncbi:EMC3/TMCO1 family protein [Candidatus Bathyarchaeota archaeon]|nr:EMC3/TMCO1 family protein [Candidatus Bathyarchaeota archaeon]
MSSFLAQPPYVTLIILFVSITMSFLSSFINSRFMPKEHREKVKDLNRKVAALKAEKNQNMKQAKSTGDKKLLKKAEKQEKQLLQLQSQVLSLSSKQFRVLPITMGVFFVVWLLLTGSILGIKLFESPFIGPDPVAYLPWLGGVMQLSLFYWYLICSFLFGTLFSRIFGLTGGTD